MTYYYAHTKNEKGEWHYLNDHLNKVADYAKGFAKGFYKGQVAELAEFIGLLHDLGKVNPGFQDYLLTIDKGKPAETVPHAPWGGDFVYLIHGQNNAMHKIIGLPVAGHHSGLEEPGTLSARLIELDSIDKDRKMFTLMQNAIRDVMANRHMKTIRLPQNIDNLQWEFLIRMLFSVLIDADRLDTEGHFHHDKQYLRNKEKPTIKKMAKVFRQNQDEFLKKCQQDNPTFLNKIRKQIYDSCLMAATGKPGIYKLTVPTGGGKTRSVLGFALEHALTNEQKTIVFALPYTSIIDQTAQIYREIFGKNAVLEHHSQVQYGDDEMQDPGILRLKLAEENWDVPLIVTTTVQLLESLFSNSPSRCRKIHNLAQSVIILDEAQSLPLELFKPTLQVLRDLVDNYGTTVVLSTATQPALRGDYLTELTDIEICEIVPEYEKYYKELIRVHYKRLPGQVSMDDLAEEIFQYKQVMVIMNTRKQALQLVKKLNGKDCIHLSTLLCGIHRQDLLKDVRRRLKNGEPVRLISTQVVEAGVDLDFPVVYRALGPLDRIVQAAGRCNREGRPEKGKVTIFELIEEAPLRGPYAAGIETAKLVLAEYEDPEILNDPGIFEEYYSRLYYTLGNDLDKYNIQLMRERLNYPKTAQEYRLIKDNTVPVVVKYGNYKKSVGEWLKQPCRDSWRRLQPYLVNIYEWELRVLINYGLLRELTKGLYMWEGVYDPLTGINEVELDPADLIV